MRLQEYIENMNTFCGESISLSEGISELLCIYRYYKKVFSDEKILYKNLIVLRKEIKDDEFLEYMEHWMKYFISCGGSEWDNLWSLVSLQ